MTTYLIPAAIEFGYGGAFRATVRGDIYTTGAREIRFTFWSDDGAKGTVSVPLEEADAERTLTEVVEHATARAKAMVAAAV